MTGIELPACGQSDHTDPVRVPVSIELVTFGDLSIAADSWSFRSEYGGTLDDDQRHANALPSVSDYCSVKEDPVESRELDAWFTDLLGSKIV